MWDQGLKSRSALALSGSRRRSMGRVEAETARPAEHHLPARIRAFINAANSAWGTTRPVADSTMTSPLPMQPSVELSPPVPLPPQLVQFCPLSLTPYPAQRVHSLNVYSVIIMSLGWFCSEATVPGVDHATKLSAVGLTSN